MHPYTLIYLRIQCNDDDPEGSNVDMKFQKNVFDSNSVHDGQHIS